MHNMIGSKVIISGMTLEIISENNEQWECLNITTKEIVLMKKSVLENAIKLGKAEIIAEPNGLR